MGSRNVARVAVRMISQKTNTLELVGAVDVDPKKVGKDVGEVFGFEPLGVKVISDLDESLQIPADIVLDFLPTKQDDEGTFMPSTPEMVKALDAGKNLLTTIPVYHCQKSQPEVYKLLDEHAKAHNVAFVPSGLLPGAYGSYIPLIISGIMGHVDHVTVQTGEDDADNTSYWVSNLYYGKELSEIPEPDSEEDHIAKFINAYYSSGAFEIADRIGLKYDEYKTHHEIFLAPEDLDTYYGPVKKGTVCGHRFNMSLVDHGKEVVTMRCVHKVRDAQTAELPIENDIRVEGWPSYLHVPLNNVMPDNLDEGYITSAAPLVNLIPSVVDTTMSGYVEMCDLPALIPVKQD